VKGTVFFYGVKGTVLVDTIDPSGCGIQSELFLMQYSEWCSF